MYDDFVREKITQLRLQKQVSEYQMSYDLGHSRGYIYNISSGKCLPPMREFFSICDYFHITPSDFFNEQRTYPELVENAAERMKELDDTDILLILNFIERLKTLYGHCLGSDS
jgi:DNA-binding XRE family transcriptional regulator